MNKPRTNQNPLMSSDKIEGKRKYNVLVYIKFLLSMYNATAIRKS